MSEISEYLRSFNFASMVLRLVLAMLSGALIGYGRARKGRNAGLRTYILTCVGAALTVLISMYEQEMLYGDWFWASEYAELKFDGSRFSAQVVNGIGFLAAGTIIGSAHQQVSGLTSAIGLFATACLGLAAGAGFYEGVITAMIIIIITMEFMQPMELLYKRRLRNINIFVEFDAIESIGNITETIQEQGAQIFDIDIESTERDIDKFPSAIFRLKMSKEKSSHSEMLSSVAELSCVYSIRELIS